MINHLWTLIGVVTVIAVLMAASSFLPSLPVFRPVALVPRPVPTAAVPVLEDLSDGGLTFADVKAAVIVVEPSDQQVRYTAGLVDRANAVRDKGEDELFGALVALCQAHGFTNEETYERLHDAVDTITADSPITFDELLDIAAALEIDHA
jgi:hypothetical protein